MNRDYKLFLKDIKESIDQIIELKVSEEEFKSNKTIQDAIIRKLEIIGEASKHLPRSLREENKHINWAKMERARDNLLHSYFEINLHSVWDYVTKEIPRIKEALNSLKLV
ncbi:DUF86 domain-containing protein [Candidatus Pacearchaeota archaeon]|nr:DUF86 domain-containing protein [Candidatus Pacearchaeota archaeon]